MDNLRDSRSIILWLLTFWQKIFYVASKCELNERTIIFLNIIFLIFGILNTIQQSIFHVLYYTLCSTSLILHSHVPCLTFYISCPIFYILYPILCILYFRSNISRLIFRILRSSSHVPLFLRDTLHPISRVLHFISRPVFHTLLN